MSQPHQPVPLPSRKKSVSPSGPLLVSVMATLVFFPLGLVAVFFAISVRREVAAGNNYKAADSSRKTYLWSGAALAMAFVTGCFYMAYSKHRSVNQQTWLVNDAGLIGEAVQSFFLSTGKARATFTYSTESGEIQGDITPWLSSIGKGYMVSNLPIELDNPQAFSMSHPHAFEGIPVDFSDRGQPFTPPSK